MNGALDRGLEQKVLIGLLFTIALILLTTVYFLTEPRRLAAAEQRFLERSQRWGAELFLLNCASCHGEQGQGLVGPALRDSQLGEDAIVQVISRGRPGTAMPAFAREEGGALTSYQIHDLARLVRHWSDEALEAARRRHEEEQARLAAPAASPAPPPATPAPVVAAPTATPAPPPTPTPGAAAPSPTPAPATPVPATPTPTPPPPAADLGRGKAIFQSQGCGACHAVAGVSTGTLGPDLSRIGSVAATRQPGVGAAEYLTDSLLKPGAFVVPGFAPVMPGYQGKLSAEDQAALLEFMLGLK